MSAEPNNVINAFSNINNSSNNNNGNEVKLKPVYGKILLTLENCILPPEKFVETPSSVDGLSKQHEYELRVLGTELIQTSGILLKLPQVAMATAQVLFHRFYYSKSFVRYPMEITAMSCITCASKIEEAPRRIRDVINVFHYMKQIRSKKDPIPLILDQNYINLKNQVIKAERRLLKELGFCVHVKHPHKFIVTLLQVLESEKNQRLMQTAWNYMNDSLRTDVFLRFTPETIACSCIYLSARVLRIPLPSKPAWFEIFGVNELDIREVCRIILKLYTAPPPNQEVLENVVNDLRKEYELQRQKLRAPTGNGVVTDKPVVESTASPVNKIKCSPKEFQKVQQINSQEHSNNATPPVSNHRAKRSRSRTRSATPEKYKSLKYSRTRTPTRSRSRTRTQSRSRSRSITPVKRHYNSHRNRSRTRSRSISPIRYRDHHHSSSNKRKRRSKTPTKHHKHHRHHHRYYETSTSSSRKSARPQSRDRYITSKRRSRSPRR